MNIYRIIKSVAYDVYDVYDMVNEERQKLIHEFHSDKRKLPDAKKNMNWDVIKLQEIKPILQQYVRDGFVRNEKAVDRITEKILRNLAKLQASTELAGHTEISTDEYFEDEGFEPPSNKAYHEQTEEESERSMDFYFNFLETEHGTPISDYGLKPLWELAEQLMAVSTAEEQIQYIDQMLQITHRRGDLASLFIEGGTASLDDLFGDMTNLHAMSNFPITTAQSGEWWIDNGTAWFADGNIGDMTHELIVIDTVRKEVMSALGYNTMYEFIDDHIWDEIKVETMKTLIRNKKLDESWLINKMGEEWEEKLPYNFYFEEIAETQGIDENKIKIANGEGDARQYGIEHLGWIRVAQNEIQMQYLNSQSLNSLAEGLRDAFGERYGGDEDIMNDTVYNIEIMSTQKYYTMIPFTVIDTKKPMEVVRASSLPSSYAMSNFPITTAQEDEDEENPILSDLIDKDKWIQKNYLFLFENPPYIIDTDNQLQQFELSLNDQFIASRDTMEDAMNAALEHYEGYLEPEIQEEVTPYQIIDSQYGYTDSLERAGYIMEDGRLVNLNRPHIDHRAVTVDGTTKSMQEFIADGNIRMSYSNGYAYITMFNKPTAAQKGKLLELFDNATNGVDVNLDKELGDYNPRRETYDGGENKINEHFSTSSKEAILGKIMSYYSDTKIYPSQFAKFMKEKDDWNWYKKAEIKSYGLKEFRR